MTGKLEQWDITSSVGLTALGVAAARAVETHRPDPLVRDPFAEEFVRAAKPPVPLPLRPGDGEEAVWGQCAQYMGLRSRFFDDYFAAATESGVDQVVLLAAGLDARAYRLDWPSDCDLYEVDQPKVLEFKQDVLAGLAAEPRCQWHPVPTDLRDDWAGALAAAGFDPDRPTAWLAEGLLPYLPAQAEEDLFSLVHKLSAPGSWIAVEVANSRLTKAVLEHPMFRSASASFGVDVGSLWETEPRRDCAEWLRWAGWTVTTEAVSDAADRYRRPLEGGLNDVMALGGMVTARRES
ncbi:class I SAM-dependent methyltransferase [Amycolatopsis nigrescens]|uniref:class I SAM-dependent methyltransferase n=1 Tax=Amycolatopsis nigrescens TaxID=381445 RepID=UPI000364D638|nr:class I SAM-dependent methyltransferase [Amycolatopsis nigrescens]